MVSPKVCDAQFQANGRRESHRQLHGMTVALAIRLIQSASFQEKLRQLVVKMRKEKAPPSGRFCISRKGRVRGKF
jgi:hypothetical protein